MSSSANSILRVRQGPSPLGPNKNHYNLGHSQVHGEMDNDLRQPPPTPVIQHYFPSSSSSSSHKTTSKPSSRNSGSSSKAPGNHFGQQVQHFPFDQQQHREQQQQRQQQQQQQQQEEMKQNFMQAIGQHYNPNVSSSRSNTSTTNNNFVFQGYNATMEEASPISPALEFQGDSEPLLLPPGGKDAQQNVQQFGTGQNQRSSELSPHPGMVNSLSQEYNKIIASSAYGNSKGNPVPLPSSNIVTNSSLQQQQQHPGQQASPTTRQETLTSTTTFTAPDIPTQLSQAVAATQKQFAHSIPSTSSLHIDKNKDTNASNSSPSVAFNKGVVAPLHPVAAAALASGTNNQFFFPHFTAAYLLQKAESAEETEEKRAKRLERNRESARKSRRRKKER